MIGAGAFGTALAVAQAAEGRGCALWGRDAAAMAAAERAREAAAAARRGAAADARAAPPSSPTLAGAEALLLALPAQATEGFLAAQAPRCRRRRWCSAPRGSTRAASGCRPRSPRRARRAGRWRR